MLAVLRDNIWDMVAIKARRNRARVAVAFVTSLGKLALRRGDTLICDASDARIKSEATDRDLLGRIHRRGVKIVSLPGLHAKCARFGKYSLVGSSNLSVNSSEVLEELAMITDDPLAGSRIDAFMEDWEAAGERVDRAFIPSADRKVEGCCWTQWHGVSSAKVERSGGPGFDTLLGDWGGTRGFYGGGPAGL